ncbi:MAG: glycosyltransferase family 4 protein [Rubrobacter sp.]|nr:glycosyltransferase family 4 protein [Rubrobacter sp.]
MRILFVAIPNSVHTARWIDQISDRSWDIHLFPSTSELIHPHLRNVTVYGVSAFRPEGLDPSIRLRGVWPLRRGSGLIKYLVLRYQAHRFSPLGLAGIIRWLKPDIVHSMEIQQAGYLTLAAKETLKGNFPPWIVSNWGGDIHLFGRLDEHEKRIRAVMSACDYYHSECHRDIKLAKEFGFKGEGFSVLPVAGGVNLAQAHQLRQPGPTSARHLIALKGYQGWAYRAVVGLRAIELCADLLKEKGYRIAIYLPTSETKVAAELLAKSSGLPIDIIPPSPHEEMLRLHGRARVSIGLSISDGLSTSALEAMLMGSFPIQSNTSCLGELVRDGESGILVHPEDPEPIAAALRRAVSDDELVDRAAEINARIAAEHLDQLVVQPRVVEMYERIANQAHFNKL